MRNCVQCQQASQGSAADCGADAAITPFQLTDAHRASLASLQLAVYAMDAMRVLHRFEQQASASPAFAEALHHACPDWRNPGCLQDPADSLISTLTYAAQSLEGLFKDLDERFVEGIGRDLAERR